MIKKLLLYTIILLTLGCSSDDNQGNQTELEGVWLLQNIPTGARLTFEKNNFTIQSGSVTINGTFEISNNQISGHLVSRSGENNEGLQPDNFTGDYEISNIK